MTLRIQQFTRVFRPHYFLDGNQADIALTVRHFLSIGSAAVAFFEALA
jgi:hypothetical protein